MHRLFILIFLILTQISCQNETRQAEIILRHYIDSKEQLIRNYSIQSAVALWNATVSGDEKDYRKLMDIEMDFNQSNQNVSNVFAPDRFTSVTQNVFTNVRDFELLKKLKFSGLITDSLLSRQLNVLYQTFMGPQIEPEKYKELIQTEIKLEQTFSGFKLEIDGKKYRTSQIDSIRKNSSDTILPDKIAKAMQQKGKLIAPDVIKMVKDRNEFAVNFGYPDFYHLALETKDQTPQQVQILLDEIELKTREQFFEAKKVIDKLLSKRYGIQAADLKPWHYNDESSSYLPKAFILKMDSLFADVDPIQKTAQFFEGIGLPVQDVFENSDLKDGPGRAKLTAMINVDFKNDIRLIAGIRHSYDGMYRMMHLGGHASHYKSISDRVPYLIKAPPAVIYEGVSRCFENLASNYDWLNEEIPITDEKQKQIVLICQHIHQVDRMFRCRIQLLMSEFEREIYRNPDQDLDVLWQNMNLKYLGIKYPEKINDSYWASGKFSTNLACNVHNFVLADVFAAQLQHSIKTRVLDKTNGIYKNNKAIGKYLVDNLYQYGNLLPWEQLIEKATGEPLNSSYFVNQMIGDDEDKGPALVTSLYRKQKH
ncbi:MAG: hypothetical protein WAO52_16540 [Prolixibacteraceae bacterium]